MTEHEPPDDRRRPPLRRATYLEQPRRDPAPITDVLGGILGGLGNGADIRTGRLIEEWDRIAGPRWEGRSEPIGVKDGVLAVAVSTPTDAGVLRYDKADLLARIADEFGPELVHDVHLRVVRRRGR